LNATPVLGEVFIAPLFQCANRLRRFGQRLGAVRFIKFARVRLNFDRVNSLCLLGRFLSISKLKIRRGDANRWKQNLIEV